MPPTLLIHLRRRILPAILLLLPLPGWAAPGEVDGRWSSLDIAGEISTAAAHPEQGIWVGGDISLQLNSLQRYLVRLLPSGLADPAMTKTLSWRTSTVRLLPDSKLLVAMTGPYALQRLNPSGVTDFMFSNLSSLTNTIGMGADKSFLFGRLSPAGLWRFSPEGTPDAAYAPGLSATINAISMLTDDSCYAGGSFPDGSGLLVKVSKTGIRDPAFVPVFDGPVLALTLQPDGKILAGGRFRRVNGSPRPAIVRLLPDGTIDPAYQANPDGPPDALAINTLLPQADGSVLISGGFAMVNGTLRPGMARLTADGALDPGFAAPDTERYGNAVKLLGLLPDGRVMADVPGSAGKRRIILLQNGPGSSTLSLTAPGEITWTRSGSVPAVAQAWFEISQSGAGPWTGLGQAERTSTGWKLTYPNLPTAGIVRAVGTGPAAGGESAGSFVSDSLSLDSPVHSFIVRRQDVSLFQGSHSSINFGTVWQGSPASIPLVLRNTGTGTLTGLTFSITGSQASAFAVTPVPGSTLSPGASMEFAVTLMPSIPGSHAATLTISTESPSALPVTISLSGSSSAQRNVTIDNRYSPAQRAEGFNADGLTLTGLTLSGITAVPDGQEVMLVNNLSTSPIQGRLTGMPQGSLYKSGTNQMYRIDYFGGDGNDLVLHRVIEGSVDPAFQPRLDPLADINSCIRLRNGGILVCGGFRYVGAKSRKNLARLLPDGSLDETFNPVLSLNPVYQALAETESGKILVDAIGKLIRLEPDGTVDSGFSCATTGYLDGFLPLPGERTLIVGRFTQVNGIPRNHIAMLDAGGAVDPSFAAEADDRIFSAIPLPDGKFLVGGLFTHINSMERSGVARLNSDGSLDTTFSTALPRTVYSLARQQDGKILCSYLAPGQIVRLLENGEIDSSFNSAPISNDSIKCLSIQANGKILAGISRGSASVPGTRFGLIRLNANGSIDPNFDLPLAAQANYPLIEINTLCQSSDGTLLVGGRFAKAGSYDRQCLVRVKLEDPVQSLTIPSPSRIEWLRGGSLPETNRISFSLHDPLTNNWIPLGPGKSIPGGWELADLSLPADGAIRATACTGGGRTNSSHSFTDTILSFGNPVPDMVLRRTDGSALSNGPGILAAGSASVFTGKSFPLSLENHGSAPLHSFTATFEGPDADAFSIPLLPDGPLPAGQTMLLPIRFSPTSIRLYTARLVLRSNDPGEPAYTINLTGTGGTPVQIWRDDYFQTLSDEGSAANHADPDFDGLTNLAEYALGFDPLLPDSRRPPAPISNSGFLELQFTPPPGRTDIRYTAESSADSASTAWNPVPNTGTGASARFRIPQTPARQFMRLRFDLQ